MLHARLAQASSDWLQTRDTTEAVARLHRRDVADSSPAASPSAASHRPFSIGIADTTFALILQQPALAPQLQILWSAYGEVQLAEERGLRVRYLE